MCINAFERGRDIFLFPIHLSATLDFCICLIQNVYMNKNYRSLTHLRRLARWQPQLIFRTRRLCNPVVRDWQGRPRPHASLSRLILSVSIRARALTGRRDTSRGRAAPTRAPASRAPPPTMTRPRRHVRTHCQRQYQS